MRRPNAAAVGLTAVVLGAAACGYTLAARPALPAGVERVTVPVFENDTPEPEVGALLAARVAERAHADDRLGGGGGQGAARIVGRIERVTAAPTAFPRSVGQAGLYTLSVRARLRLVRGDPDRPLAEVVVEGDESYPAGAGPEQTEADRRRALDRLLVRLADEAWARLVVR